MSFTARLRKLEAARAAVIKRPPLSNTDTAHRAASIIACATRADAPPTDRARAGFLVRIFEAVAERVRRCAD